MNTDREPGSIRAYCRPGRDTNLRMSRERPPTETQLLHEVERYATKVPIEGAPINWREVAQILDEIAMLKRKVEEYERIGMGDSRAARPYWLRLASLQAIMARERKLWERRRAEAERMGCDLFADLEEDEDGGEEKE